MKECQQVSMCHVMILECGEGLGRPRWFQLERFSRIKGRRERESRVGRKTRAGSIQTHWNQEYFFPFFAMDLQKELSTYCKVSILNRFQFPHFCESTQR